MSRDSEQTFDSATQSKSRCGRARVLHARNLRCHGAAAHSPGDERERATPAACNGRASGDGILLPCRLLLRDRPDYCTTGFTMGIAVEWACVAATFPCVQLSYYRQECGRAQVRIDRMSPAHGADGGAQGGIESRPSKCGGRVHELAGRGAGAAPRLNAVFLACNLGALRSNQARDARIARCDALGTRTGDVIGALTACNCLRPSTHAVRRDARAVSHSSRGPDAG
jgi:hypothetical protein